MKKEFSKDSPLAALMSNFLHPGNVDYICVRPERSKEPLPVEKVNAICDQGLQGDHYSKKGGNRQVTLIQAEHIKAVESILQKEVSPLQLRRNIVVSGINLLALQGKRIKIGEAELLITGDCPPCSRMEENLGFGGYIAMRGHGGVTASVITSGEIKINDKIKFLE
ncbi:MAG: MOSC domain-containing protein [Ignavibacteriaceae bacterium]|nr:MOSC domain-containing protein [Ignavibacteriaceae bacterium]